MRQDKWAQGVVAVLADAVLHHRKRAKKSAQGLANICADLGYPALTRAVIANLETGARDSISVPEWLVLAAALRVPPLLLLSPVGHVAELEVLPDVKLTPLDALDWMETGRLPSESSPILLNDQSMERYEIAETVERYRRHKRLVGQWEMLSGEAEAVRRFREGDDRAEELTRIEHTELDIVGELRDLRYRLRSRGLTPPDLPTSFASSRLRLALGEGESTAPTSSDDAGATP